MTDLYGCSDHNCIYGHKGGMGTNGGCRCEKELHRLGSVGIKAARQIRLLRELNKRDVDAEIEVLNERILGCEDAYKRLEKLADYRRQKIEHLITMVGDNDTFNI